MTKQDYVVETIQCSLDEQGCPDILTTSSVSAIAKDILSGLEMWQECSGQSCIENPFYQRERELNERIKQLEKERDKWIYNFKNNIAMRRGCEHHQISLLENGHAEIFK